MAFSVAMRKLSEITFVFKEMARQQKERSERERQRAEQERRKEKEEEDALEQVFILIIRRNYFFQMCFFTLGHFRPALHWPEVPDHAALHRLKLQAPLHQGTS